MDLISGPTSKAGTESSGPSRVYELFVLGVLMARPLHGYAFQRIANTCLGPFHQLSWGTLYPLIRRLVEEGFIEEMAPAPGEQRRTRKVYQLTDRGRQQFLALMLEPGLPGDYPVLFAIKLANFGHITPAQRLALLRHYRGHVQYAYEHRKINEESVRNNPDLVAVRRSHILRLFSFSFAGLEAEMRWVDSEISSICEPEEIGRSERDLVLNFSQNMAP